MTQPVPLRLYLDQNYLSGMAKNKPAFVALRASVRAAVDRRAVVVLESAVHALALTHCRLVTCDAFMADVIRRARLDVRHGCELYTGRRADVIRLTERLEGLGRS